MDIMNLVHEISMDGRCKMRTFSKIYMLEIEENKNNIAPDFIIHK